MFAKENAVTRSNFFTVIFRVVAGWGVGYFATLLLTQGMSASEGYAWLSGWWLAAYLSRDCEIRLRQAIYLFIAAFLIAGLYQAFVFVTRQDEIGFPYTAIKVLIQGLIFASPAYFSAVWSRVERLIGAVPSAQSSGTTMT